MAPVGVLQFCFSRGCDVVVCTHRSVMVLRFSVSISVRTCIILLYVGNTSSSMTVVP